MPYLLALDQGTTSSRALVVDADGRILALAQRTFAQHFPRPGWVEHDPDEIWATQLATAREALAEAGIDAAELAGIGITNQRETTVVWDRETGRPLHRAIVWQDRRTADVCARLRAEGHEAAVRERTGLVLDPYFSGTKIAWLLDHVEGARAAAEAGRLAFGTIDSWLTWHLTGGATHATDATNASRTLLYDIHAGAWDADLCALLRVPMSMLPDVVPTSGVCAHTAPDVLGAPVPIAAMVGDQQGALFGQLCTRPGMLKNTYGTGCFVVLNTGDRAVTSSNGLLTTVAWRIGDEVTYALEGSVFVAGAAVQWLRDGLGLIDQAEAVEALALGVDDAGGVYFVPALTGLGAPHWDAEARGTLVGLTRGTTRAHIARATLDGVAHQVADVMEAMRADAGIELAELRVDGGAAANDLLMQAQADLLGVSVARPAQFEATAMGAAYFAGLATGVWPGLAALEARFELDRRFEPQREAGHVACERAGWARAVAAARAWSQWPGDAEERG